MTGRAGRHPAGVRDRRWGGAARVLVLGTLLVAALLTLWRAADAPAPPLEDRVRAVAAGLRCPSCTGESVADSQSDLARQMRTVVTDQLRAGRSPDEVRAWFADRYGDGVLLDPPRRGPGWVLVLLPTVVVGGLAAVVVRGGAGRRLGWVTACTGATAVALLLGTGALPDVGRTAAGSTDLPGTVGDRVGEAGPGPLPAPSALAPATREAARALAADDPGRAESLARRALAAAGDDETAAADPLLVLGLAQQRLGDPQAGDTLAAFLAVAPDHPLADRVRALLSGR